MTEDLLMWNLIAGAALPGALAVIMRPAWRSEIKVALALAACFLVALATDWLEGDLGGKSLVTSVLVVAVSTKALYEKFWKPLHIAPVLEERVNVTAPLSAVFTVLGLRR